MVEPEVVHSEPVASTTGYLPRVAATGAANAIGAAVAALAGLIVARALGPSDRGVVAGATAWAGLLALLASLGLVHAVTYYVACQRSTARTLLRHATGWVLPTTAATATGGLLFSVTVLDGPTAYVYGAAFVAVPLSVIGGLHVGALQALHTAWWNVARLVQQGAYLGAVATLFFLGGLGLASLALVILGSMTLQFVAARRLVERLAGDDAREAAPANAREILRYGRHNLVAAIPNTVNARLDQALLALVATKAELGSYAVAVSLSLVAGPLAGAFGNIAFPRSAALLDEHDRRRIERTAVLGALLLSSSLALPLGVFAPWIVHGLFGADFEAAVPLVRILAPAGVALACNMVLADLLRGRGQPRSPAVAEAVSAVLTVLLLATLAPRFGALAAAWTSVVAYSLSTLLLLHFLRNARS